MADYHLQGCLAGQELNKFFNGDFNEAARPQVSETDFDDHNASAHMHVPVHARRKSF